MKVERALFLDEKLGSRAARNQQLIPILKAGLAFGSEIILELTIEKPPSPPGILCQAEDPVVRASSQRQHVLMHAGDGMSQWIMRRAGR